MVNVLLFSEDTNTVTQNNIVKIVGFFFRGWLKSKQFQKFVCCPSCKKVVFPENIITKQKLILTIDL